MTLAPDGHPLPALAELEERRMEDVATRAAQKAIAGTFLNLGIDVSTPEALLKAQRVITFGYRMHDLHSNFGRASAAASGKFLAMGVIALLVLGFKDYVAAWFK